MDIDIATLDLLRQSPTNIYWEIIGIHHQHGINTPLFSLYTPNSAGIGEYLDLIPLIDQCQNLGYEIIQLLPLNDTGTDPSPYNAQSSCALHPINLSLHALPNIDAYPELVQDLKEMQKLNELPRVDYHQVRQKKERFLQIYFQKEGKNWISTEKYKNFIIEQPWLPKYALFKTLKEHFQNVDWRQWPLEYIPQSPDHFQSLYDRYQESIDYYSLLQYFCFQQLNQVKTYAENHGIFLKGDIPILISPDSADTWSNPELFLMEFSAGAPPDIYTEEGQYWGFPLFNWENMEAQNFGWWKQRLQYASSFYHLYRIDHIIGIFRLWCIPHGKSAKEGYFLPEAMDVYLPQGEKILRQLISAAPILPIGEDLGVIPPEVRECMLRLGICGTKVLRWERAWLTDRHFIPINEYTPVSMTTVSTHDSEPIALWWNKLPDEAKAYAESKHWTYSPDITFEQQKAILYDSHHSSSLFHINLLIEYLALFPELHHPDLEEERINTPGIITDKNWTYRYRLPIHELFSHPGLTQCMKELIQ